MECVVNAVMGERSVKPGGCGEPVNWYFLQSVSKKEKLEMTKNKKEYLRVCVYEVVQICQMRAQGAPLQKSNNRATERRVKEDSKRPMTTMEV